MIEDWRTNNTMNIRAKIYIKDEAKVELDLKERLEQ